MGGKSAYVKIDKKQHKWHQHESRNIYMCVLYDPPKKVRFVLLLNFSVTNFKKDMSIRK